MAATTSPAARLQFFGVPTWTEDQRLPGPLQASSTVTETVECPASRILSSTQMSLVGLRSPCWLTLLVNPLLLVGRKAAGKMDVNMFSISSVPLVHIPSQEPDTRLSSTIHAL